jgi:hypothetical protein
MICWRCHSNSVNTGSRLLSISDVKTSKTRNVIGSDKNVKKRLGWGSKVKMAHIDWRFCCVHWHRKFSAELSIEIRYCKTLNDEHSAWLNVDVWRSLDLKRAVLFISTNITSVFPTSSCGRWKRLFRIISIPSQFCYFRPNIKSCAMLIIECFTISVRWKTTFFLYSYMNVW